LIGNQSSRQIVELVRKVFHKENSLPLERISDEVMSSYRTSLRFTEKKLAHIIRRDPVREARWEQYDIDHIIPKFVLPKKVDADRGGNLRPPIDKTTNIKSDSDCEK
jgi:hypothetical protein